MTKKNPQKEKLFKQIIFLASCLFFVLMLTWALLSANGRRVSVENLLNNTDSVNIITKTGGIRINNNQFKEGEIQAFLGGQSVDITEDRIENVDPGEYELKLKVEGYSLWESKINVDAQIITDVSPFFFPEEFQLQPKIARNTIDKITT